MYICSQIPMEYSTLQILYRHKINQIFIAVSKKEIN
jgi:hypothetical protein